MPYCVQPGCSQLVPRGRCPTHALDMEHARRNRSIRRLYYTVRWRQLRHEVLVHAQYTCAVCGCTTLHLEVDHIEKHGDDPKKFWPRANLQALCAQCHTRKTRTGE